MFDGLPRVRHSDHRASISEICGIAGFRLAITAQLAPHTRFIVPFLGWLRFSDACMDNHIILVYLAPSTFFNGNTICSPPTEYFTEETPSDAPSQVKKTTYRRSMTYSPQKCSKSRKVCSPMPPKMKSIKTSKANLRNCSNSACHKYALFPSFLFYNFFYNFLTTVLSFRMPVQRDRDILGSLMYRCISF